MAMSDDEALRRELTLLQQEFVAELPARLARLAAALEQPEPRTEARRLAHQLRGSAGSYGLDAVSVAAGELEEALLAGTAAAAEWARLRELVERG